ncbi:MAG: response regulator [Candidatus Limnocylindrales bacterium]
MTVSSSPRILLVDDSRTSVLLMTRLLALDGYDNVEVAMDREQAVAAFERHRPDLVVMDFYLPDVEGFELLEYFTRPADERASVDVIVLSAELDDEVRRGALARGARKFLLKLEDAGRISEVVAGVLADRD